MLKNVSVIILGSENVHGQEWTGCWVQGGELRSGRILLYRATVERVPGPEGTEPLILSDFYI